MRFESSRPLVSICIPTNGRVEMLLRTLSSIFDQISESIIDKIEIVIADNSVDRGSAVVVDIFKSVNLRYFESDCDGFQNTSMCISFARGVFVKLSNDSMLWVPGAVDRLLSFVAANLITKPTIFFTDCKLLKNEVSYYKDFDQFINAVGLLCTWSNGFSMWNYETFSPASVADEKYFPQTLLLFNQATNASFCICDYKLTIGQPIIGKGGYDIFDVFGNKFVAILDNAKKSCLLSSKTVCKIKRQLIFYFFPMNYFKSAVLRIENFDTSGIKIALKPNFNLFQIYSIYIIGSLFYFYYIYVYVRRLVSMRFKFRQGSA